MLIPSIERTITAEELEHWDVRMYLGIDHDDAFWIKHHESFTHPPWLTIYHGFHEMPANKIPFNKMMQHAYDDGAKYMVRINDDTEFKTKGWITLGVRKLLDFDPPNVGVVGPACRQGNIGILTHDMVHRTHLEIFDTYYPAVFSAWYIDNWITQVYRPGRSSMLMLKDWEVLHHTKKHGTRYKKKKDEKKFLHNEISKGRDRVSKWVTGLTTTTVNKTIH